jgi:membrane-associated phospholipid phosphatase
MTRMSIRDVWNILKSDFVAADVYAVVMMTLYAIMALVYHNSIVGSVSVVWTNVLVITLIAASIVLVRLTGSAVVSFVRYFYVVPIIYMMYDQTHLFVPVVNPHLYDNVLIAADRALFGQDPTVWLSHFANPFLTEFLQICYFLFYFMPVSHAVELWMRGETAKVISFARMMAFMFFISYVLYFLLPAVGPRFTLHDFALTNSELPGLWLTETLRSIVNIGGGVVVGTTDPAGVVNRDCMPSGHTMLTMVNIVLAFQNRSKLRYVFLLLGTGLIFATVYLRYHYVIDLIAGAILVIVCMPLEIHVDKFVRRLARK